MQAELEILLLTAITISMLHTLAGPDHYVPFIALSKSRSWSFSRTLFWTVVCGCGHIWSSVILGLGGAAIGWSLSKLTWLEEVRGGIAGWALAGFGFIYCIWGLVRAGQNRRHKHFDTYEDGALYVYEHRHGEMVYPQERHAVTPWTMFLIFVLGPCEPMIPLLYFPAAKASWWGMLLLIIVYTLFTLLTMVLIVLIGYYGLSFLDTKKLERYMHALGGLTLFVCGMGMVFMEW
ncbi:MAG: sulfite exporter TauE/SafE family protein [Bacteroidota bacterium]|nr:sulfite exporter TauE/SafE family protein [Bacteroidota bacterium]